MTSDASTKPTRQQNYNYVSKLLQTLTPNIAEKYRTVEFKNGATFLYSSNNKSSSSPVHISHCFIADHNPKK